MISCLENSIFIGSGISRDMTVVSPRSIFEAKPTMGCQECHDCETPTRSQKPRGDSTCMTPDAEPSTFVQTGSVYAAAFLRLFLVRHAEALANPDLRYLVVVMTH